MGKIIGMVIVGATLVVAHCLIGGTAFAAVSDDTLCLQCPAEEYLTIETWYPSPYNEYEELRLYPIPQSNNQCNNDNRGLMYYSDTENKVYVCKGPAGDTQWQELGGGFWQFSGNDISNVNSGKVIINGMIQASDVYLTSLNKSLSDIVKSVMLANGIHSANECLYDVGGAIFNDGNGNKACRVSSSSCPGGWKPYESWTTTEAVGCNGSWSCGSRYATCGCSDWSAACSTGQHPSTFSNSGRETCGYTAYGFSYPSCYSSSAVCYARITSIGCY